MSEKIEKPRMKDISQRHYQFNEKCFNQGYNQAIEEMDKWHTQELDRVLEPIREFAKEVEMELGKFDGREMSKSTRWRSWKAIKDTLRRSDEEM